MSYSLNFSCFGHIYLISHNFKALDCFRYYLREDENQLRKGIKALRIDRVCTYLSKLFKKICEEKEIMRQMKMPYTLHKLV